MALHNSFKQGPSQQQGTRLAAVPTTEDLTYALAQAGKNSKNPVVISWNNSKTSMVFWLSVTASSGGADAEWLLQKGEENAQPKDIWNHKTADISLIQSLVSAEEEMARKAGAKGNTAPSQEELNKQRDNIPGNPEWNATISNPNAPIVLGGGFQAQPQRPSASSAPPPQWQSSEISGWNAPQPAPEQMGFGDRPAQNPANTPDGAPSNPFAALKGTVEEPKPVNPFNALMSNQSLPQLPQQEIPGSSLPPEDDPSINPYDSLTKSGGGIKPVSMPPPPAPPTPPQSPALPKIHSSQTTSSTCIPVVRDNHPLHGHPRVPDFSAMRNSSDKNPVLSVHPDNALNPKAPPVDSNQTKTPLVINQVSARPAQPPPTQQSSPAPAHSQTPAPAAHPQSAPEKSNFTQPAAPQKAGAKQLPTPIELDRVAVDNVFKSLSNPETGLLNHGSLLFFLVREFSRYQCNNEPFSLIIMEMNVMISGSTGGQLPRPLPPRAVRAAAEKICTLTRPLDLLTHYEQSDYAILLPATNRQQAAEFALGVGKALLSKPLLPDMEPKSLVVHMGVASFPEDTSHPGILLAAAGEAKSTAQIAGKPIILFAET